MASGTSGDGGSEHRCGNCGDSFESPQALGGHVGSCSDSVESEQEPDDDGLPPVPSRDWFEENTQRIIRSYGPDNPGGRDDSDLTKAGKAFVKQMDHGADGYTALFGQCNREGCDNGCNGFEAGYCFDHTSSDESEEDDSEGGEVNLSDLAEEDKQRLVEQAAEKMMSELGGSS